MCGVSWQRQSLHWCGIDHLVFPVTFQFTNKEAKYTEEHNYAHRHQNNNRAVDLDCWEKVENTSNYIEDVYQLLELESEGYGEECEPSVLSRFALVCWARRLLLRLCL